MFPRFQGENLDKTRILYLKVEKLAEKHICTAANLHLPGFFIKGMMLPLFLVPHIQICEVLDADTFKRK
ncbi:hypothetical protein ERO13_D08G231550v2 [Gossypium hirsutum]|nr:hypothetical protein ERO13_D08G231550v2 [Gossypium hirsutum]